MKVEHLVVGMDDLMAHLKSVVHLDRIAYLRLSSI